MLEVAPPLPITIPLPPIPTTDTTMITTTYLVVVLVAAHFKKTTMAS